MDLSDDQQRITVEGPVMAYVSALSERRVALSTSYTSLADLISKLASFTPHNPE